MKDRVPNQLLHVANKVAKIPFAKPLLKPFYYYYKKLLFRARQRHFQENAISMLYQFDKCCLDNNYNYFLIFGTLLGAIREHGLILHDFDVDVALFIDERTPDFLKKIEESGFRLIHRYSIGDGKLGCEDTFEYKDTGVSMDVFYVCPPIDEYPYCCCWNKIGDSITPMDSMKKYGGVIPRRIELPIDRDIIRVKFENIEVNIPRNAHQISEFTYGENYMTPDPNYKAPKEHRVIWYDQMASYEEF